MGLTSLLFSKENKEALCLFFVAACILYSKHGWLPPRDEMGSARSPRNSPLPRPLAADNLFGHYSAFIGGPYKAGITREPAASDLRHEKSEPFGALLNLSGRHTQVNSALRRIDFD